jgi:hypothetical protein
MAEFLSRADGLKRFHLRGLMKTLRTDKAEILSRLAQLRPDSQRQWGRMTPHQMLCHLSDAYQVAMGEREERYMGNILLTTVGKWIALYAPLHWPKGIQTGPASDQEQAGTRPVEFAQDKQKLETLLHRFTAEKPDFQFARHPGMGRLTVSEWMRWGWLHADHHLRQFGL